MAQLSDLLQQAKHNEVLQNESALSNQISASLPPAAQIEEAAQQVLAPFVQFCTSANIRHLPAAPATCATFLLSQAQAGIPAARIAAAAAAIELLHDHYALANPIDSRAVRWALDQVLPRIEPPRSWTKEQKAQFASFPREAQEIIAVREKDRETALRRSQNETADLRRLMAVAVKTADNTTTEKDNNDMAKTEGYEKGIGPYSKDDVKMTRQPDKGYVKPVDISKKVDPSWERTEGFSAKLDKGGE